MKIVDNVKEIADLVKKVGDIDLYRKIVELEGEVIDLTRENRDQQLQIEALTKNLALRGIMTFTNPFWYMEGDSVPFCPRCWENDAKTIHLNGPSLHGQFYVCPQCGTAFNPRDKTASKTKNV